MLPMAITNDMVVAIAPNDENEIKLHHIDSNSYQAITVNPANIVIDARKHLWSNYFLAGVKGILDHAKVQSPRGCNLMVHGNVPVVCDRVVLYIR